MSSSPKATTILAVIGPGILVAATGVGAGDLATAAFTGKQLGLAVLWAVICGAAFKFVLNEGLARWQLATGKTLLEGCIEHFGKIFQWLFLTYLVLWSYLVAAALMSAIGVTAHAIWPLFGTDDLAANRDKVLYGILHSLAAIGLVYAGGYKLFERIMSVCVVLMFSVVLLTAFVLRPPLDQFARGLFVPIIPTEGLAWTVALLGGVGGTLTILCYGYWIREEGRLGTEHLKGCRLDLAVGYAVTALFGLAMVVVGNSLENVSGTGANLIVSIGQRLEQALGPVGFWMKVAFLAGAWGAVFSSLLGVWQSVPYLFADFWRQSFGRVGNKEGFKKEVHQEDGTEQGELPLAQSLPYQGYLWAIGLIPILGLVIGKFSSMQQLYAVIGALCIPLLTILLLILNGSRRYIDQRFRNHPVTNLVLVGILGFFVLAAWLKLRS